MWEQEVTAKASKTAMKTLDITIAVLGGYKECCGAIMMGSEIERKVNLSWRKGCTR
jgi:hypothetical protein